MPITDDERRQLEAVTEDARTRIPSADPDGLDLTERIDELRQRARNNPPGDVAADIEADAQREAIKRRERDWHQSIPARFHNAHPDDLDGTLADLADEWDGTRNVLLLGDVGVGKTHAAVAIARQAHDRDRTVMFRSATRLLDELRPGGPDDALETATGVDVLILDDVGSERPTDWTAERLRLVVDERYNHLRPTIITSNLNVDDAETQLGRRMWSRLYEGALRLTVAGEDRRKESA